MVLVERKRIIFAYELLDKIDTKMDELDLVSRKTDYRRVK